MLYEFGFRNFFSFREGVSISLRLDANCPSHISNGKAVATVLGIKGANASGKTHLLKALPFLAKFCANSFSNDPKDELLFSPFFDSTDDSDFYVEFSAGESQYRYELTCTEKEVLREAIYLKNKKTVKIFERIRNDIVFTTKKFELLKQVRLRGNASIISTAHQYEFAALDPLYKFFSRVYTNVGYSGMREKQVDLDAVSKYLHGDKDALEFVKKFLTSCDTGISNIRIIKRKNGEDKDEYSPIFDHKNGRLTHSVTQYTESSGTKALFRDLPMYRLVLMSGGVLVFDEFDIHLHPHILPKLLELFLDEETNRANGQIIFSTHDSSILDILGRYRAYLVNKRENESFAVRLDEIPGDLLRNDRSIRTPYEDGKVGGVPRI